MWPKKKKERSCVRWTGSASLGLQTGNSGKLDRYLPGAVIHNCSETLPVLVHI